MANILKKLLMKYGEAKLRRDIEKYVVPMMSGKSDMPEILRTLPFDSSPGVLPPAQSFKIGTPVRLNTLGKQYFARKIRSKTKSSLLLSLLTGEGKIGIIQEVFPASVWGAWDGDDEVGSGGSDVADVLLAVPVHTTDNELSWECFMKYSGYLEEVPESEIPEESRELVLSKTVPSIPAPKTFCPGDSVIIDEDIRSNPYSHLKWPSPATGAGTIIDVFPTQYICTGDGSIDGVVRPFDCVVSIYIPHTRTARMFHHYSGWLIPA